VHEVVEIKGETSKEGKVDVEMGIGDMPVHRVKGGDSFLEDYLGDSFEKVGEINLGRNMSRLFLKVNRHLLKPAPSPSKHLPHGLFLKERLPSNKALYPNQLKNPYKKGPRLQ